MLLVLGCGFGICPVVIGSAQGQTFCLAPLRWALTQLPPQPTLPQTVQSCQWEMNGFAFPFPSFLQGKRTAAALPVPREVSALLL